MANLRLKIFDADPDGVSKLKSAFGDTPAISIEQVDTMAWSHPPPMGIDVLFLIPPAAERWGSIPVFGKGQILATSLEDQRLGWPPFIVTGPSFRLDDPQDPITVRRLTLAGAFEAIRAFNNEHNFKLTRIGFWANNLLQLVSQKSLTPDQVKSMLMEVAPELAGAASS